MGSVRSNSSTCSTHRLIFRFFFTGRWKELSQPTYDHAQSRCKCVDFFHRFLTLIHLYVSQFLTTGPEWEVPETTERELSNICCYISVTYSESKPYTRKKVYGKVQNLLRTKESVIDHGHHHHHHHQYRAWL